MEKLDIYHNVTKGAFQKSELAGWTMARPWPDHWSHFDKERSFFQEFLLKTISFVQTIQDLTDLDG